MVRNAVAKDKPTSFDLRTEFRIGTWNVKTVIKTGYMEAICQKLRKYRVPNWSDPSVWEWSIDDHTMIHSGE